MANKQLIQKVVYVIQSNFRYFGFWNSQLTFCYYGSLSLINAMEIQCVTLLSLAISSIFLS